MEEEESSEEYSEGSFETGSNGSWVECPDGIIRHHSELEQSSEEASDNENKGLSEDNQEEGSYEGVDDGDVNMDDEEESSGCDGQGDEAGDVMEYEMDGEEKPSESDEGGAPKYGKENEQYGAQEVVQEDDYIVDDIC